MNSYAKPTSKGPSTIEVYNKTRRILLNQIGKDPVEAYRWLETTYRKNLDARGYAGLKAEMNFLERYGREFRLVVAADIGDATDFAGVIDGTMHRIDVTTNASVKRLKSYEPLQLEGHRYKIAVLENGEFDIIDINFPICEECDSGRVLPTGMLLPQNTRDGESLWSNDQLLVNICSHCGHVEVADRITTPFLHDFEHIYHELNDANNEASDRGDAPIDVRESAVAYARQASRYLSGSFGTRLVATGGKKYEVTDERTADGHWTFAFVDQLPLVQDHLQPSYPWHLELG